MEKSNILIKNSSPKIFVPLLAIGFVLQAYMLIVLNPKILAITNGLVPLDLKMGFSVNYAIQFLQSLGDEGKSIYLNQFLLTDWFFSLISGIAWSLFLTWFYKNAFSSTSNLQKFGIIPLFITFFDYIENFCFVYLTMNDPDFNIALSKVASVSGVIKNFIFIITIIQILFLLLVLIKKRYLKN